MASELLYPVLAETAMVVHFAFLAFLIVGGFVALRWRWVIVPHVLAAVWAFINAVVGVDCPLTYVEDWARENAGQSGLGSDGFIAHYLTDVVYPESSLGLVRAAVVMMIVTSWAVFGLRWRRRAHQEKDLDATMQI